MNINLEDVKVKLYERLRPSGWGDKLKTFIMSQDFDKILQALLKDVQENKRFTPVLKQVFRAFEECPYSKLKVVIIGQDPYPQAFTADGIAFSCSNTGKIEASLRFIHKEISDTVYNGEYEGKADLKDWSNQGILLLNSAFTTTIGKIGAHYTLWQPFMAFIFDILSYNNEDLIYVFLGKKAQEWVDFAPEESHKLFASHPASAAYNKLESWDSDNLFNKVSSLVEEQYKEKIIW